MAKVVLVVGYPSNHKIVRGLLKIGEYHVRCVNGCDPKATAQRAAALLNNLPEGKAFDLVLVRPSNRIMYSVKRVLLGIGSKTPCAAIGTVAFVVNFLHTRGCFPDERNRIVYRGPKYLPESLGKLIP